MGQVEQIYHTPILPPSDDIIDRNDNKIKFLIKHLGIVIQILECITLHTLVCFSHFMLITE